MKVSLNWIRDYVKLPEDMDLKRLAYDLTMSTVEVEDAVDLGASFHDMVVGEIKEVLPHPNADKLRICRTDIGGGDIKEIVCGGTNLRDGMKVAVALPGSFCRWHGEGEPVEIKQSKLRGVESYGMICGAVEIGLADLRHEKVKNLAYGKQKMTELGRALMLKPALLILDEPAAGLNPSERREFVDILLKTHERGIDLFLIEHNMDVVMNISTKITVLNFGAKIAEGTPYEIQNNDEVIRAYLGDKYKPVEG